MFVIGVLHKFAQSLRILLCLRGTHIVVNT